jgi:hypothetical protein
VDEELCRDLAGKCARKSAKKTSDAIADVRDRYEMIAQEFRVVRGEPHALATLLRGKYETDAALNEFLPKLAKWISEYVSDCVNEHTFAFTPDYRQILPAHTWTLSGHSVSRELLTALAEEYVRDRAGLMRFLEAVFKRWRKIFKLGSSWQIRLVKTQLLDRNDKAMAAAIEKTSVSKDNQTEKHHDQLMWRIRQVLKREREGRRKQKKKAPGGR